jgi:carbon monoxide dehydrogenase subunit G
MLKKGTDRKSRKKTLKYLKYILGSLALLVVGFLALGFIKPTLSYDCEINVDKPQAESWAVMQDPEKLPEWLIGFQKIEHVSGTPGTVGAVSDMYFNHNGEQMVIQETITNIIPDESISLSYTSDFMNMNYRLAMTSANGKTQINSSTTTAGNGIISRSIMALMANSIREQEETNLANLKKAIEQNRKRYLHEG